MLQRTADLRRRQAARCGATSSTAFGLLLICPKPSKTRAGPLFGRRYEKSLSVPCVRMREIFRRALAVLLSPALLITTTPIPAAQAFLNSPSTGGGVGAPDQLNRFGKPRKPSEQAPSPWAAEGAGSKCISAAKQKVSFIAENA